jgi:hypothetical protein
MPQIRSTASIGLDQHGAPGDFDDNLTTTRAKQAATPGNSETKKSAYLSGLCNVGKHPQTDVP